MIEAFDVPLLNDGTCPAWFADPSAADLRQHLDEYLKTWGPGSSRFANPRLEHFQLFVLHTYRAAGHGSLSYLAQRKIEAIFEAKIQELVEEELPEASASRVTSRQAAAPTLGGEI